MEFLVPLLVISYIVFILSVFAFKPVKKAPQQGGILLSDVAFVIPTYIGDIQKLPALINDLVIHTPAEAEIIVVLNGTDDEIVQKQFLPNSEKFKIITLKEAHKKKAILLGANQTNKEYIWLMDADLRLNAQVDLNRILKSISYSDLCIFPLSQSSDPKLDIKNSKSWLALLLNWEWTYLQVLTLHHRNSKRSVLANAANLLVKRSLLFEGAGPYQGNMHIGSGDDIFLLQHAKALDKEIFLYPGSSFAWTAFPKNLKQAFRQRLRWATKNYQLQGLDFALGKLLFAIRFFLPFLLLVSPSLINITALGILLIFEALYLIKPRGLKSWLQHLLSALLLPLFYVPILFLSLRQSFSQTRSAVSELPKSA
ncbi:MAG: glycosyltransferase [Luteibaculum sp.]